MGASPRRWPFQPAAVHVLPAGLAATTAQSATTLATAIHAAQRAGEIAGQRVALVGPGHAGLLLLQVCRLRGPQSVVVLGTRPERLAVAQLLGADAAIVVGPAANGSALPPEHQNFDVVFEAAGTAAALAQCFALCRGGGTIVSYGIIDETLAAVPGYPLYAKELNVLGSRGAAGCYAEAIQLLADGHVRVEPLVTHWEALENAPEAMLLAAERRTSVLRVVLTPTAVAAGAQDTGLRGEANVGTQ